MTEPFKILLVDDSPANLALLIDYLSANFKIYIAENGSSALERLSYIQPDLILLDVMMPGMSGFEVGKAIKANPQTQHIPIIFLTAREETADKLKGFAVGGVDYMVKPLAEAEVLARVNLHLQLRQKQQRLAVENFRLHEQLARRMSSQHQPTRSFFHRKAGLEIANNFRLTLFNQFELTIKDEIRDGFRSDVVRALLAYLVLEGTEPIERAVLAERFWPNYLEHTRRNSLRVALHNLRQVMKPLDKLLITDRKTVQFYADPALVWCDALAIDKGMSPTTVLTIANAELAQQTTPHLFLPNIVLEDNPYFQCWQQQRRAVYQLLSRAQSDRAT